MNVSIFDALGPIMIGPSSSHTAGAARLARVAAAIAGAGFRRVRFGLSGSFAHTYRGHGTDRALVAGVLGVREDDERLSQAFELARAAGLDYEFYPCPLEGAHENTVKISFFYPAGEPYEVVGSSIGGGQILITSLNGFTTEITAQSPTLIIQQRDHPGVVARVAGALSEAGINIATMKLSRTQRGDRAFCVIELDAGLEPELVAALGRLPDILSVEAVRPV